MESLACAGVKTVCSSNHPHRHNSPDFPACARSVSPAVHAPCRRRKWSAHCRAFSRPSRPAARPSFTTRPVPHSTLRPRLAPSAGPSSWADRQIGRAVESGFVEIACDSRRLADRESQRAGIADGLARAREALVAGRNVIFQTARGPADVASALLADRRAEKEEAGEREHNSKQTQNVRALLEEQDARHGHDCRSARQNHRHS